MRKLYISSSSLKNCDNIIKTLQIFEDAGIKNIELGSAHSYRENIVDEIKKNFQNLNFIIHNFFPPQRENIILNQASQDKKILHFSRDCAIQGIYAAKELRAPIYGYHPGFRIKKALKPGFTIDNTAELVDYNTAVKTAVESAIILADIAKKFNIKIAAENLEYKNSAYMLCSPRELLNFVKTINRKNFGILLDIGHLKIASKRLNFTYSEFREMLKDNIILLHINTNNGIIDSHDTLENTDSLEFLGDFPEIPAVLELRQIDIDTILRNIDIFEKKSGENISIN